MATPTIAGRLQDGRTAVFLAGIVALGSIVRLIPVAAAGLPLNDGALFLSMADAIRNSGFALPQFATYNGTPIPLAYPPLGLYFAAGLTWLTGGDGTVVAQWLPLAFSMASIPVAFLVFREIFDRDVTALIGTAAFALIPRSYNWTIGGGGLTRAPGMLLAMIAMWAALRMVRSNEPRWVWISGVAGGLAGLFHPESGVFAALAIGVISLTASGGGTHRVRRMLAAWVMAAAVVLPWLALVLSRHGLETLIGALQTGGAVAEGAFRLITFGYTEGYFEVLSVVGAVGMAICLLRREWLLPVWTAVIFLAGSRASLTYAAVPLGATVAVAVVEVGRLLPALLRRPLPRPAAASAMVVLLALGAANAVASAGRDDSPLRAVSTDARAGLRWIAQQTPAGASFLVMAGEPWPLDAVSEWFPIIAHRHSLATVQGSEWSGPGAYSHARGNQAWLLNCSTTRTATQCADDWSRVIEPVDYLVLARGRSDTTAGFPCCRTLADQAVADAGELVFENSDVAVIKLRHTQ